MTITSFLMSSLKSFALPAFAVAALSTATFLVALHFGKHPKPTKRQKEIVKSFLRAKNTSEGSRFGLIAHRGGDYETPENTLASFRHAKKCGCTSVELDVEFTLDGEAVVIHDTSVDRTTDGSGLVHTLSFDDISKLNAGHYHRNKGRYPNEKVPTLEAALLECLSLDLKVFIDVKATRADRAAEKLSTLFERHPGLYENAIVCSFYPTVLSALRYRNPRIIVALTRMKWVISRLFVNGKKGADKEAPASRHNWVTFSVARALGTIADVILDHSIHAWLWRYLGVAIILSHKDEISHEYLKFWRSKGIQVVAWTVNCLQQRQYFEEVIKCPYMTDCPDAGVECEEQFSDSDQNFSSKRRLSVVAS